MLVQIENAAYPVTVDALHTVFSPYGFVQKIAIFEKNSQNQVSPVSDDTTKVICPHLTHPQLFACRPSTSDVCLQTLNPKS